MYPKPYELGISPHYVLRNMFIILFWLLSFLLSQNDLSYSYDKSHSPLIRMCACLTYSWHILPTNVSRIDKIRCRQSSFLDAGGACNCSENIHRYSSSFFNLNYNFGFPIIKNIRSTFLIRPWSTVMFFLQLILSHL